MVTAGPIKGGAVSLWTRRAIQGIDFKVRQTLGVAEFAGDEECILRIGLVAAPAAIALADGEVLAAGDPVVELHFWNEHLALIGARGIGFGAAVHRRLLRSLSELATAMRSDPRFHEAKAVCAHMASASRHDTEATMRFAARFGFEVRPELRPQPFRRLIDDAWLYGLTFAFRPHTLRGRRLLRAHYAVWISRVGFDARFGGQPARVS